MNYLIATVMTLFGNEANVDFVTHYHLIYNDTVLSEHQTWIACSKEKNLISGILEVDIDSMTCKVSRK